MYNYVVMILELGRPIWTAHSENARDCRGPSEVLKYYMAHARHEYMTTLEQTAKVLMNTVALKRMGISSDFSKGLPANLTRTSTEVETQDDLAAQLMELFVHTCFARVSSMMHHSHSYPGLCCLCASEPIRTEPLLGNQVFDYVVQTLRRDCRIWLDITQDIDSVPTAIRKLVNSSPFQMRYVREMAVCLTIQICKMSNEHWQVVVRIYARYCWSGWGQTKICEDAFKMCRQREDLDSLNGIRIVPAYLSAMSQMGAIKLHDRREVFPSDDEPKLEGASKDIFISKNHEPSIPNHMAIMSKATWPTFSAQSSKVIPAHIVLLRQLDENDEWSLASKCWQSDLFPAKTVIWEKNSCKYYLVLGSISHTLLVLWQIEVQNLHGKPKWKLFIVGGGEVVNRRPVLIAPLDLTTFEIVPTMVVSPTHYHLLTQRKFSKRVGVMMVQTCDHEPVLYYGACRAFHQLTLSQLKTIASEQGIDCEGVTLPLCLQQVCRGVIEKHRSTPEHPAVVSDQEMHAILALRFSEQVDMFTDIADEDLLRGILGKDELEAYQAWL